MMKSIVDKGPMTFVLFVNREKKFVALIGKEKFEVSKSWTRRKIWACSIFAAWN